MKTKYYLQALTGIALAAITMSSCTGGAKKKEENKTRAKPPVAIATVSLGRPAYTLELPAELKPYESVELHAKVRGFVKRIFADRGAKVYKGQLLALLEAPEMGHQHISDRANQDKLMAQYQFSRQAYERLRDAAAKKSGSIAAIEIDRARSQMRSDSAAYVSARSITSRSSQLTNYLRITAPFSGTITGKNVSEGALVGETGGMPLFTLAQNNKLRLSVAIPEVHANSVYPGMRVSFTVMSSPGKKFDAILSRNSDLLNTGDRSLVLEFDVDNPGKELRGGDYARVSIPLQRKEATLFVPSTSIMTTQSGQYVLKMDADSTVRRIQVKEGIRKDSITEIFGPLQANDKVLKVASEEITDGERL